MVEEKGRGKKEWKGEEISKIPEYFCLAELKEEEINMKEYYNDKI